MENKIEMSGFRDNKRLGKVATSPISNARMHFDGNLLDELEIKAVLKSQKDVDQLIELLKVHQYCFKL